MNKKTFPLLLATAMVLGACSNDTLESGNVEVTDDSQKTKIAFSMSDEAGSIEKAPTRAGFTASTGILMHIVSTDNTNTKYTKTWANADTDATQSETSTSAVTFNDAYVRYWDDAYGRAANLSVYAIAIPSQNNTTVLPEATMKGTSAWTTGSADNTVSWTVPTDQSTLSTAIDQKDLTYSNNISDGGSNGRYEYSWSSKPEGYLQTTSNGRMVFQLKDGGVKDGPGKFNKGHMIFKHAMSRLTLTVAKNSSTYKAGDFTFNTGTGVQLDKMPYKGTFDVAAGTWAELTDADKSNISKMAKTDAGETAAGTYLAQVVPGFVFTQNSDVNVIEMHIDNNDYYITSGQIFKALNDKAKDGENPNGLATDATSYTMEQGKNYSLSVTIGKTGIEAVTCTLVPWTNVDAAEIQADNAHFSITTQAKTSEACNSFDLYRLLDETAEITLTDAGGTNYNTHYTEKVSTDGEHAITATDGVWSTPWYWENNKAFYHFRTVNVGTTINTGDATVAGADNFDIASGPTASTDPHWGAPMQNTATLKYSTTNGFASSVYHAIGATRSQINIKEHHMMANVEIIVCTPDGADAIELGDGSTDAQTTIVKLINFYDDAKVRMGTGLVNGWSDLKSGVEQGQAFTKPTTYGPTVDGGYKTLGTYTYSFVPQTLNRNTGVDDLETNYVGLVIKTPDSNQYFIIKKLYETNASSVSNTTTSNQVVNQPIHYWYPGHKYVYTITISKKGIEAITCSLVAWTTVTGNVGNITLED